MSPIPDSYSIPVGQKKEFDLLPEDVYQVQITKLDLKEDEPIYQSDEVEDKFAFEFTIVEDGQYKGRKLWLDVRTAMNPAFSGGNPSWLYKLFCAVNNVVLGDEESKSVTATSINDMLGKQLRLTVKQKMNQVGKMKNKIADALPLKGNALEWETAKPAEEVIENPEDLDVEGIPF